MDYHTFNIGKPSTTAWWQQNVRRRVITAGFEARPGDRGDEVLHDMAEGDWIFAYCNGHGFVGAGLVGPMDSYVLHPSRPSGSLSTHQHERHVDWQHVVDDVAHAVSADEAGVHAPRQTKQRLGDASAASRIISLLSMRATNHAAEVPIKDVKYWHVLEAVKSIARPCSVKEITDWLKHHYPHKDSSDARDNAALLTVNDANRRHHDRGRQDFRTDRGNPKDALFRNGRYKGVTYELYRPMAHGVWDLQTVDTGAVEAVRLVSSPIEEALAEVRQELIDEVQGAIGSIEDERIRALRAVVLREGQSEFRSHLLNAYDSRCAMTGCKVVEILEAAHIKPYFGSITNRVDNGLLLRADIHTLFDKGLIWVDDGYVIRVSKRLFDSEYGALDGSKLLLPRNEAHHPHPEHVADHRRAALGDFKG